MSAPWRHSNTQRTEVVVFIVLLVVFLVISALTLSGCSCKSTAEKTTISPAVVVAPDFINTPHSLLKDSLPALYIPL